MRCVPAFLQKIATASGVKQYFSLFVGGALLMLTLPPNFIFPAWLSFSLFYLLLTEARGKRHAFWLGWWFGFGYFVFGFYWVSHSLMVDPLRFAWLIPFALTLIPAISAIFTGLCAVFFVLLPLRGVLSVVCFAGLWVLFEVIRGVVTQFPWNFIGYGWAMSDLTLQMAYWVKVWGMSFFAVLVGTLPILCVVKKEEKYSWKWHRAALGLVGVIVAVIVGYGQLRLSEADTLLAGGEGKVLNVRIVQANIEQKAETTQKDRIEIVDAHIKMTKSASQDGQKVDLIIWPESAVPFILDREPELRQLIAEAIPEGAVLATGGIRMEGQPGEKNFHYWNSLFVLDDRGEIADVYDKSILVPFGEFVPFSRLIPFVERVTEGLADFDSGDGVKNIPIKGRSVSIAPLICYEAAFPSYVSQIEKEKQNAVIVNVTNDAWFGNSIGPYQHYYKAKFRAVETSTPLMRAANTGISGAFDAFGRGDEIILLNQSGILDIKIPLKN